MIKMLEKYNKIVVTIDGYVDVWRDNWEKGDVSLETVNSWLLDKQTLRFDKITKKSIKEIKQAIFKKLNDNLYNEISMRKFNKYIQVIDNRVYWSQYTNDDNTGEPTRKEYREFRKGLIDFYVQDINITVEINGQPIEENDLITIIENK